MLIKELFPYRISGDEIDELINALNMRLRSSCVETVEVSEGYIELESGIRYAIQTYHGEKIYNLKELKSSIEKFANNLIGRLDPSTPLYIREQIVLYYQCPSHIDPYTFDYTEHPTKGCWIPYCRIRQPGHEIKSIDTSDIKRLIL